MFHYGWSKERVGLICKQKSIDVGITTNHFSKSETTKCNCNFVGYKKEKVPNDEEHPNISMLNNYKKCFITRLQIYTFLAQIFPNKTKLVLIYLFLKPNELF